jgi:hypothetical protein
MVINVCLSKLCHASLTSRAWFVVAFPACAFRLKPCSPIDVHSRLCVYLGVSYVRALHIGVLLVLLLVLFEFFKVLVQCTLPDSFCKGTYKWCYAFLSYVFCLCVCWTKVLMYVCVQTSMILQNTNGQKKMYTPVLEIIEYVEIFSTKNFR